MKYHVFNTLFILVAALLSVSCTTDVLEDMSYSASGRISFTATTEDAAAATRGIAIDAGSIAFDGTQPGRPLVLSATVSGRGSNTTRGHRFGDATTDVLTKFRVSAIKASSTISAVDFAKATPDFFYNLKAEKNGSGVFDITQDYYWPSSSEKLWFYAYTPCDTANVVVSSQSTGGAQKVSFTVDADVTKQLDLMTADAVTNGFNNVSGASKKSSVALSFRHELTAVRFVIGEQWLRGSIKSVAIRNVHGKGTLTIGDGSQWEWKNAAGTDVEATDSYELTLNKSGLTGNKDEEFMTGDFADQYFLMIPQSFSGNDAAVIEVKYQDLAKEYTVRAFLKDQPAWERNTTVTYAISSHTLTTLKIGTVAWPNETETGSWKGPKIGYEAGDTIGLYVVDPDGTTIPENRRNIKCTYDGASWSIQHPSGDPIYKLPGYQYFFYYPYTPTLDTTYPITGQNTTETSASDFFGTVVSGWIPAASQNSLDKLNRQDLQISKGVADTRNYSTVNAQMTHQMNICKLALTSKEVNTTITYKLDANYTWVHGGGVSTIAASADFDTNIPYHHTDDKYYYVYRPVASMDDTGTVIKARNTSGGYDWSRQLQSTARGIKYEDLAVTTGLSSTARTDDYTLQLYDLYYSTGAISHELITGNDNYGDVIGLVTYIGDQTNGDGTISGRTHGLVLAKTDYTEDNGETYRFYYDVAATKPATISYPSAKSSAWMIPRFYQWQRMFIAAGGGITELRTIDFKTAGNQSIDYGNFISNIAAKSSYGIGGIANAQTNDSQENTYWTSDPKDLTAGHGNVWHWHVGGIWDGSSSSSLYRIRLCLAF